MENIKTQDILSRIDSIIQNSDYLREGFMTFEKMAATLDVETTQIRANAIMEMVNAREKTNQQMILLLQKMLDHQTDIEKIVE